MLAPRWSLADVAEHAVDFWLTTEDLPLPENRVTVDGDGAVHLAYRSTNDKEADRPLRRAEEDPEPRRHGPTPRAGQELLHEHGHLGSRRGPPGRDLPLRRRPGDLGARPHCKAHEVDNLYVVDTSFFPSIGAVNPALTAMANAIRVGDHLIDQPRSRSARTGPLHHSHKETHHGTRRQGGDRHRWQQRDRHGDRARAGRAGRQHRHRLRGQPRRHRGPRAAGSPRWATRPSGSRPTSARSTISRSWSMPPSRPSAASTSWSTTPASRPAPASSTPPSSSTTACWTST